MALQLGGKEHVSLEKQGATDGRVREEIRLRGGQGHGEDSRLDLS